MVNTIGLANSAPTTTTLVYNGRQARQLNDVAFAGATSSRPLGALTGVRPGTPTTTVTATSTTWTCGPFSGMADVMAANESGGYPFSFDAATTPSAFTPNNATLPRQDIIVVTVVDPENGSTTPTVTRAYVAGTVNVGGTLTAVVPPQSFVIAYLNMPAATGAPSVTWVAPYTVAAGGTQPVATLAALNLTTGAYVGQSAVVYADSTTAYNRKWYWNGTAWTHSLNGSVPFAMAAGTTSNPGGSTVTVTFPTGRFTVAPLVTMANTASTVSALNATSITATNANMGGYNSTGTAIATSFMWVAVQMTATTAAG